MKESNSISVSNEAGFTLLEILIAITLLAFITIGVVSITDDAAQTMERTTEINENNLQIETAMSRFDWDFSQIYSPLYFSTMMNMNPNQGVAPGDTGGFQEGTTQPGTNAGNTQGLQINPYLQQYYESLVNRFERNEHFMGVSKEGLPVPRFHNPEKDVFEFFTSSNRRKVENQKQSHFAWVRYTLGDQDQTEEEESNNEIPKGLKSLIRYVSSDDPYSEKRINIEDAEKVKGAVLLRNVEKLEFNFWDQDRRKWETSLRSIQGGENLIRGVKVLVTWYDSYGTKRSTARIFRTNWPMVTPVDQTTTQGGNVSRTQPNTSTQDSEGDE
jgi:hypothetical protein